MAEDTPEPKLDSYAVLKEPYIGAFTVGRALSNMSMQVVSVAVGWDLYERTANPLSLGLVGAAQVAPAVLLMLLSGSVSDRFSRRNIAMIAASITGACALGLAYVSWTHAPVEVIYVLLFISGAARTFSVPAVNSMLAHILRPELLSYGYAWLVSSSQLANMTGPAAGGFLIGVTGGAAPAYLVAAASQLIFVALLATLPRADPPPGLTRPGLSDIFGGIGFIKSTPVFLAAITLDLFAVLFGGAIALLPVFAKDVLDAGASGLGLLRSSPAVGAVLTTLILTRLPPWQRPGLVMLVSVATWGAAIVAFGMSRELWLSMLFLFISGCADSISVVIRGTIQQVMTPNRLRGRVSAVNSLFVSLSNELGGFRAGVMASSIGAVPAVVFGGAFTLAVVPVVALLCRQLVRVGPLHTLQPEENKTEPESVRAVASKSS
ncbi:MAG TPA: MFS transporter [Chloroflexota bacterium]|nr:MFS transporter [Chloroflexota bacterium]